MKTAEAIVGNLPGWRGHAALYRLTPPLGGYEWVIVSAVGELGTPQTAIWAADAQGKVWDPTNRLGVVHGVFDHTCALRTVGYEIGSTEKLFGYAKRRTSRRIMAAQSQASAERRVFS